MVPEVAQPLADLTSELLSSDAGWNDVTIHGFVKGNERGCIAMSKTTGLLPQSVFLIVMNRIIMLINSPALDRESARRQVNTVLVGGAKATKLRMLLSQWLKHLKRQGAGTTAVQWPRDFVLRGLLARRILDSRNPSLASMSKVICMYRLLTHT